MNRLFKISVGIGGPTIIMIFVVLCLAVLGCLSLVTANSDWKLTKKFADAMIDYYEADCQAEEIIADFDDDIKSGENLGLAYYNIPVSHRQIMVLELVQENSSYRVRSQKLSPAEHWNYEDYQTEFSNIIED